MSRLRNKNKTAKRQPRQQRQRNTSTKAVREDGVIPPISREQHQYYTSMKYDGNTLSVESKQDNQPVRRKKYTLKQLRREIPVAAELINKYLDGKVPRSLHRHQYPPHTVSIYPVLPNPVDLGLLPPAASTAATDSRRARIHIGDEFRPIPIPMSSDCSPSTCERSKRHHGRNTDIGDTDEMMKLFVSDRDDRDDRDDRKIRFM